MLMTSAKKRDKVSIAITSSEFYFSVFLGLPQWSILCPLFFIIYINNLSNQIVSTVKQLAADDILFSIINNAKTSANELNSDLKAEWTFHNRKCHLNQI